MEKVTFLRTESIQKHISALFESEKLKLTALLPRTIIEHVGGTSIPGSLTKGDLDINVRVDAHSFAQAIEILKSHYDINQPNNWKDGFASFKDDARDLGIQLTIIDSPDDVFVMQREYLRSHPAVVEELNVLKESFDGKDMNEYRISKEKFFAKLNPSN